MRQIGMLTLNDPMLDSLRRFDGWLDGEPQPAGETGDSSADLKPAVVFPLQAAGLMASAFNL